MSLDSDVIVDRRRIRRKLTFWRVTAALVAIAAIAIVGMVVTPGGRSTLTTSGSIARINIDSLIRSDNDRVEALERLEKSQTAAVIVHINSPGGTTAGSEQLYDALMRLKAKKPLVVVVEGLAASGGYITAIAADHIVAQQSSLVGSIGVLFQYPNFTELLKTVGVKVEEVKSSAQKGVKSDLPVRDFKLSPRFGDLTFLRTTASIALDALGLSAIARQIEQAGVAQAVDRLSLDGMLALWHPAGTN